MDLRAQCPQCKSVQILEIIPSNLGNTFDLKKARCGRCGYRYGEDWKDLV
jgi:predicted Zn-ribbon and HTH transcriptional regulator